MSTVNPLSEMLQNGVGSVGGLDKTPSVDKGFGDILTNTVKSIAQDQKAAEKMAMAAASGEDVPMHEVISAVSKAETTLQTMVSVRDKAVEAYQEILRMPI